MSTPGQASKARSRTTVIVAAAAVLAAALVVLLIATQASPGAVRSDAQNGPSQSASSSAAPSAASSAATPPPAPPGTAAPAVAVPAPVAASVTKNAAAYVGTTATALATVNPPDKAQLSALATGSAYDSLMAKASEFKANGWHLAGKPKVVSTKVVRYEPGAEPPTVTLNVCVDSSAVSVLTSAGATVQKGSARDRSLNVMTLVQSATRTWLVSQVTFPDNPDC
ncbi:hypothetical protein ACTWLI_13915 [Arthrobacter sp. Hor0625]|uniref:hypothetical protein n=1 Tax=Arthrobacter sp. Hor0625 TaxID=3457358 RepID=UPI00403EF271